MDMSVCGIPIVLDQFMQLGQLGCQVVDNYRNCSTRT